MKRTLYGVHNISDIVWTRFDHWSNFCGKPVAYFEAQYPYMWNISYKVNACFILAEFE